VAQQKVAAMDIRVPVNFVAVVSDRLVANGVPTPQRLAALAVLGVMSSDLITQSLACRQSARDLVERLQMDPATFVSAVKLLAECGAVTLGAHQKQARIHLTPPGVSARHGPVMARRPLPRGGVTA
jgi:hypothetical protein